jgi:hypothetical protein
VKVAIEADFLYSYSTLDGTYSLRDEQTGSLYIQTLCDLIEREPHEELSLLLVDVSNVISKFKTQTPPLIPTYDSRLRKRFYLARQQANNQRLPLEKSTESGQNANTMRTSIFETKSRLLNSNMSMDTSKASANNNRKVNVGKFSLFNTKQAPPPPPQRPPSSSTSLIYTSVSNRSASFSAAERSKIQASKVAPKKNNRTTSNITVSSFN